MTFIRSIVGNIKQFFTSIINGHTYSKFYPTETLTLDDSRVDERAFLDEYNRIADLLQSSSELRDISDDGDVDGSVDIYNFLLALYRRFARLVRTRYEKDNTLYEFLVALILFIDDLDDQTIYTFIETLLEISANEFSYVIDINNITYYTTEYIDNKLAKYTPSLYTMFDSLNQIYAPAVYRYYMLSNKNFVPREVFYDFILLINGYYAIKITHDELASGKSE